MQTWQNKDRAERTGRLFNLLCFYFVQVRTPPQAIGRGECVYEPFVPGENLTRGSRRNQLRRGHGSPPVLSEVPHELSTAAHSKECKRSPQQFIPAGFPLHNQLPTGTEDSAIPPTTSDMVRSGRVLQTSVKSPFQFYFSLPFFVNFLSSQYAHSGPAIHTEE